MLRPPTHRADAPIVYVHPSDPAWNKERIDRELREYREAEKPESTHPVLRYRGGFTRYDVAAVADYLAPDATRFYLKRIGAYDWQEIESLRESSPSPRKAFLRALALSLTRIENGPTLVGEAGAIQVEDLERIAALSFFDEEEQRSVDVLYDLARAAYTASMPLSKAEKKA